MRYAYTLLESHLGSRVGQRAKDILRLRIYSHHPDYVKLAPPSAPP